MTTTYTHDQLMEWSKYDLQAEVRELASKLRAAEAVIAAMRAELAEAEATANGAAQQAASAQRERDEARDDVATLRDCHNVTADALAAANVRAEAAERERDALAQKIAARVPVTIANTTRTTRSDIERMFREHAFATLRDVAVALLEERNILDTQNETLQGAEARERAALDAVAEQESKQLKMVRSFQAVMDGVSALVGGPKSAQEALAKRLASVREEAAASIADAMGPEMEALRRERDAARNDVANLTEQVKALGDELAFMSKSRDAAWDVSHADAAHINDLRAERDSLCAELAETRQLIESELGPVSAETPLEELQKRTRAVYFAVPSGGETIASLRAELERTERDLRGELEQTKFQRDDMADRLADAEAKYAVANTERAQLEEALGQTAETAQRLAVRNEALTAALRSRAKCGVIHADYPAGTTCLDVEARCRSNPHRYGEPLKGRLERGEERCDGCVFAALLAQTPDDCARVLAERDAKVRAEANAQRDEANERLAGAMAQISALRRELGLEPGPTNHDEAPLRERLAGAMAWVAMLRGVMMSLDAKLTEVWGKEENPHAYARGWVDPQWGTALAATATEVAAWRAEQRREVLGPLADWPVVHAFALAMVAKLEQHKPKKGGREGWEEDDPLDLMRRVQQEARELSKAINRSEPDETVLAEAADVANMAMMVADAYGALATTPREGT